ncbi:NAD-dependent dehydratase [Periweissella cryptocerci]|uniref:NAD-dependent dehydratase n=1 Tax=Periweissella cryptocerci TaxID=2506420 RepID=A0A4P6YSI9_9LACO|nr:NAD(P)H-binding protein [Periweissella cryptocerci]QBO35679.1 NAD-dependent dehydratase [Periweissella cryptocerci]
MTNIVILGAHGKIAQLTKDKLLTQTQAHLRLFLRDAARMESLAGKRIEVVEGDVTDLAELQNALTDQDVVFASLAGNNIVEQASKIVTAMHATHVKRLIWISSLGIYDEVPGKFGEWTQQQLGAHYLPSYREAADVIEASDLAYTILRPAYLTDNDETEYEITQKHEAFKGTEVAREAVAMLVADLVNHPEQELGESIGVNKPNTDGDRPMWIK